MPESTGLPVVPRQPSLSNADTREAVAALLALVAALFVAYRIDVLLTRLRLQANQTFNFLPVLWAPVVANGVAGLTLLLLVVWLGRLTARPWIGLVYVIAGVAAVIYMPAFWTFRLQQFGFPSIAVAMWTGVLSYWSVTGTVLALAGGWQLWPRRRLPKD